MASHEYEPFFQRDEPVLAVTQLVEIVVAVRAVVRRVERVLQRSRLAMFPIITSFATNATSSQRDGRIDLRQRQAAEFD